MRSGGGHDKRADRAYPGRANLKRAALAVALCVAVWAPGSAGAVDAVAADPDGAVPPGVVADADRRDADRRSVPLVDLRPTSPWLGTSGGRGLLGPEVAASGLLLDLHPLHNGFRLSFGQGFERPGGAAAGALAGGGFATGFGGGAGLAPVAGPGGTFDSPWYMGLGWTGSLGGNVSLFVDVGANSADAGVGAGLPPVVFDLGTLADDPSKPTDDAFSRLFPMLSVSFAYRF